MEYFIEGSLVCKAKSVVSTLFGIMLWTSTSSSPMQFPKEGSTYPGLKMLVQYCSQGPQNLITTPPCYINILHSYMIPCPAPSCTTSPPLSRSLTDSSSFSPCSSAMDDLIGSESGACMNSNIEEDIIATREKLAESYNHIHGKRKQRFAMRKKYPPPIPLLARTGNLPGHMPWILSRHYIDGRLVLIEERVRHHEYFEAHRENGRLLLNLVPMDDKATCSHFVSRKEEEKELQDLDFFEEEKETKRNDSDHEEEGREAYQEIKVAGDEYYGGNLEDTDHDHHQAVDDEKFKLVTTSTSLPKSSLKNGRKKSGDLRKCFTYGGRMISDINLPCNAHRNATECMNIHSGSSAPLVLGNIRHPLTTVV